MLLGIVTILPAPENRSRNSHVSVGNFMREHAQPTTAGPARAAQYVRMSTEHQQYSTENQMDTMRRNSRTQRVPSKYC